MTRVDLPRDERLLDLLAERATQAMSADRAVELDRSVRDYPDLDADELGLAAAAADLAFQSAAGVELEPMPQALRAKILDDARSYFERVAHPETPPSDPFVTNVERRPWRWFGAPMLGWYAAAAILLLGFLTWPSRTVGPVAQPGPERLRAELIDEPGSILVAWGPSQEPGYEKVTGDVVWSNSRQAGFMRLRGLPVNSPPTEQYQLWIVDPARDERPIDGGVFDIPAGRDEVIVPIDAKLGVVQPAAFAITLEQAGGVVVSGGPLLVVAPV